LLRTGDKKKPIPEMNAARSNIEERRFATLEGGDQKRISRKRIEIKQHERGVKSEGGLNEKVQRQS